MRIYDHPLYYQIAFGFNDPKKQADFFERLAARFGLEKPRVFLDIACGPSTQLRELARRGYECIGVDSNPEMIRFLRRMAKEEGLKIHAIQADLRSFRLNRKADLAFIMLGSIFYAKSERGLVAHLNCVARSLKSGSLYVIENVLLNRRELLKGQSWTSRKEDISIRTSWKATAIGRRINCLLTLDVIHSGKRLTLSEKMVTRLLSVRKLESLIESSGYFEVLGLFDHFKLRRLRKPKNMNLLVLRRL